MIKLPAFPGAVPRGDAVACWRSYLELVKPRVVALMMFTVAVGMVLSTPVPPAWRVLVFGVAGIGLVAASAAAINHVIDRRIDALMQRTRGRPLPQGSLDAPQALAFAAALGLAGASLLLWATNALCTALTLASLVGYALIYSLVLKPRTPQNIVIGGAAGATPPLLGWVAVTGQIDPGALVLFLIVLIWTPPHFWALAIHRREDYARAGVPMLPVVRGVPHTARHIQQYTVALCGVSLLPTAIGLAGMPYLVGASLLGARFVLLGWRLGRDSTLAMATFRFSIVYLAAIFALLLADHLMSAWIGPT